VIAQAPASTWERVQDYAGKVEEFVDAPVDDVAAIFELDPLWLGGMLLGLKFLVTGLLHEFKKR
jgi:hypothetical protein